MIPALLFDPGSPARIVEELLHAAEREALPPRAMTGLAFTTARAPLIHGASGRLPRETLCGLRIPGEASSRVRWTRRSISVTCPDCRSAAL